MMISIPVITQKRGLIAASAVVVLVLAVAWIVSLNHSPHVVIIGDLFFDESTSQFSRRPSRDVPPTDPGGQVRVVLTSEAAMLVPDKLPDAKISASNIQYLFRFTPEAKAHWEQAMKTNPSGVFTDLLMNDYEGKEVRRPAPGSPWLAANSPQGQAIVNGQP